MAKSSVITMRVTLLGATRTGSSKYGNPSWILHTSAGDFRTQTDSQIGYEVNNHTGGPDSWIDKPVTLTMTLRSRVYAWALATDNNNEG